MSYKIRFEVEGYQCLRCGHKWIPRSMSDQEPTICPACKSPYWNKERRADIKQKSVKEGKVKEAKVR